MNSSPDIRPTPITSLSVHLSLNKSLHTYQPCVPVVSNCPWLVQIANPHPCSPTEISVLLLIISECVCRAERASKVLRERMCLRLCLCVKYCCKIGVSLQADCTSVTRLQQNKVGKRGLERKKHQQK